MKIMSIVGARPNFIKMFPLIKEITRQGIDHSLVHTGQHYDYEMSDVFFIELNIKATTFLNVGSGLHGYQTGNMLIRLEKIMLEEKPDIVLVPGDTNTTLAGALAAAKLHIPVGHIEAGLRSFDRGMPEEINRILVDHCSDYLFCPTETAVKNLKNEGIKENRIFLVGDTMVEACDQCLEIAKRESKIFEKYNIPNKYFLATVHRAENTDNKSRLENIINAFINLDTKVVFPLHPRTAKKLHEYKLYEMLIGSENILLTKPLGYLDFLILLSKAEVVITDSGGVQKEAFFFQKPCITLRETTEWKETIELGQNILVGTNKRMILEGIKHAQTCNLNHNNKLFGDGTTGKKIISILTNLSN